MRTAKIEYVDSGEQFFWGYAKQKREEVSVNETPDWAQHKEGDSSKWLRPYGWLEKIYRRITDRHEPCGGVWERTGIEGMSTTTEWWRCNRCGAQTSTKLEH
jgi:hypothetical protein